MKNTEISTQIEMSNIRKEVNLRAFYSLWEWISPYSPVRKDFLKNTGIKNSFQSKFIDFKLELESNILTISSKEDSEKKFVNYFRMLKKTLKNYENIFKQRASRVLPKTSTYSTHNDLLEKWKKLVKWQTTISQYEMEILLINLLESSGIKRDLKN